MTSSYHGHEHHHHHHGGARALGWALGITIAFTAVEAAGGFLAHSLALLADAAHMLMDAVSLALAVFAAWMARRPATAVRTYGWARMEILAALVNGALLLAVTFGIVWEAVLRLLHPEPIHARLMLGVAAVGLAAAAVNMAILHRSRDDTLNLKGAYLHVLSDALGGVAAVVAALVIMATGWLAADPVLSILLSLLLIVSAVRLTWQSVDVLLENAPSHVDMAALEAAVAGVPGVERVHDLHVWTVGSGFVAMSGHAVVTDAARAQGALVEINRAVRTFGIRHVTVQIERTSGECVSCD